MAKRIGAAIILTLLWLAAGATPHLHDGNDPWIVPGESGWGTNIFHQGGTLFASLFVYGAGAKARWYTASSLVGDDGGPKLGRLLLSDACVTWSGFTGRIDFGTDPAVDVFYPIGRIGAIRTNRR